METVFIRARRTISWERERLSFDKVEAVEFLDSWFPINLEDEIEKILKSILKEI